jgi:hypothetical protein
VTVTVTNVDKNTDARTLTITSKFQAPIERVWRTGYAKWPPAHP